MSAAVDDPADDGAAAGARVCVVGGASREQLLARLDACGVALNEHARTLLAHRCFDVREPERLEVLQRSPAEVEHPTGFYLRIVDGVTWLRGYRCDDEYVWPPDAVFAVHHIRRSPSATTAERGAGWEA